jgi:transposase
MQTTIAVDLAKNVFEIAVSLQPGRIAERKRLSRSRLPGFFLQQPAATVLMEACGSSHHWARMLQGQGHQVRLLPPHHVSRYRTGNKTDRADARALLEAHRNEEIQPVPVKSVEQQALAALHRLRSRYVATRTSRINTLRGVLREFGLIIPTGGKRAVARLEAVIHDSESNVPALIRPALAEACQEIRTLAERIESLGRQLEVLGRRMPVVAHLKSIPGIGDLTATALVAFVGDVRRFRSGRHFASYLGLVPREFSSGETQHRGRITKRGDTYLRMLLIHGARSVLVSTTRRQKRDALRDWALALVHRRGHNTATVALANHLARIAWRVWREDRDFIERRVAATA